MRRHFISAAVILAAAAGIGLPAGAEEPFWGIQAEQLAVSYTHLTLPTTLVV